MKTLKEPRKMMVISFCLMLAMISQFAIFASGDSISYSAKATGMDGEFEIVAEIEAGKILNIEIKSDNETAGVGDRALSILAEEIVAQQSLGVDSVSGATISSVAMKSAVADILTQAGEDPSEWRYRATELTTEDEELFYDVVVVGSGLSGLTAALSAQREGAKVAVVEKLGIVGGTSIFSSGAFIAAMSDEYVDAMVQVWIGMNAIQEKNTVDAERVYAALEVSPDVVSMYEQIGVDGSFVYDMAFMPNPAEKSIANADSIKLASVTPTYKGGYQLIAKLEQALVNADVDIYLNTKAV